MWSWRALCRGWGAHQSKVCERFFKLEVAALVVVSLSGARAVEIDVFEPGCNDNPLFVATFVMVAKDMSTGKSVSITPLIQETEKDENRFAAGEARNLIRKQSRKRSLFAAEPDPDEVAIVHDMLVRGNDEHLTNQVFPSPVFMRDTRMDSMVLCQPQERNFSGNIFGGWLMRKAFEIGRANAYTYSAGCAEHCFPVLLAVDDILFLHPVTLGTLLQFHSQVTYSSSSAFVVEVETRAHDLQLAHKPHKVTNRFHFSVRSRKTKTQPRVLPRVMAVSRNSNLTHALLV